MILPLLMLLAATAATAPAREPGLQMSVVRVVNFSQRSDWFSPWRLSRVQESSATGFIIKDGLVMTNAHAVSDSRYLLVFLHGDPEPHEATVETIAHDCDLALLRLRQPEVMDDIPRLRFGGTPELGSTVVTLGYPVGGSTVSSTQGVVSRIEAQVYSHSGMDLHQTVQTDAAINPGNSGGPVLQEGKVVGVAFQAAPDLQSVGFFIPMEVIDRFLRDVADGRYEGYPELGISVSGLENPAARHHAGMIEGETGVRIDGVFSGASGEGLLRSGDVLLEVDGLVVANDGSVEDGGERLRFGMLVDRHLVGEQVALRILRDGQRLELVIPLQGFVWRDKSANLYDRQPRYFIYGGLVFVPLDREMMKTFGQDWVATADKAILHEYFIRPRQDDKVAGREQVVLLRTLKDAVNAEMAWSQNQVVERVNGRAIGSLEDLIEAIEGQAGEFHVFEFTSYKRFGVLRRQDSERAHQEILRRYGIELDRSL